MQQNVETLTRMGNTLAANVRNSLLLVLGITRFALQLPNRVNNAKHTFEPGIFGLLSTKYMQNY